MDWFTCLLCSSPFWGAILMLWIINRLQMRRYVAHFRSNDLLFLKTKDGDLILQGQSRRNWIVLFFLGLLEFVFWGIIYQGFRNEPITWNGIIFLGGFAIFVGWLIIYILRLKRIPPLYFDAKLQEIRFEEDSIEQHIPFANIERIDTRYEKKQPSDGPSWDHFTITLTLKNPKQGLPLAQLSGSPKKMARRKDELVALIESVIQVDNRPPQPQKPEVPKIDMATQTPNESLIVENLRKIQTKGGDGNFVIFEADQRANCYIQFTGQNGSPALYAEAASNQVIEEGFQLSHQQQTQIEALGWSPPGPGMMNYFRDWLASSDNDLLAIAKVVMQTFSTGYDINPHIPLAVNLNLE